GTDLPGHAYRPTSLALLLQVLLLLAHPSPSSPFLVAAAMLCWGRSTPPLPLSGGGEAAPNIKLFLQPAYGPVGGAAPCGGT
uniref:Uncharacterized protein n=1 Tax=Aegilops tauschii subsp. strangulata TaxID=200361 RepID=A0A453MR83_AEGTS